MARKIRIGIIGCGKIAHMDHVPHYKHMRNVEIVSLLDVKRKQIDTLKEAFNLDSEGFTNKDKFFDSGLDAVSICTPNCFHYAQTITALKKNMHVLCEKPMAATLGECTRMIAAAKRKKRTLQINQTLRYLPLYRTMADLVQKGTIGDPLHVRCIRAGASTPDIGWSPGAKWFVSKEYQGGVILDIAVHMADLMRWVAGDITHVAAFVDKRLKRIDVPDNVSALTRFSNGATGVLELSWTFPVGAVYFEVYGTKGILRQGFDPEHPLEIMKAGAKDGKRNVTHPPLKKQVKTSQQVFVDAILGKASSDTPGELGRDAVALCDAIAKSGQTGKFVRVKRY
ncbi:MAG: Gfo/Idh/MocA family oxidoreductase [Candidatus Hydrogenedentota bacterium]